MSTTNTLSIAHRVCPALSKTAVGFDTKKDMVKATTASLAAAIREFNGNVRLTVILDGCPDYRVFFAEAFSGRGHVKLAIEETPSIGNQATYARQCEILLADKDADLVYFSEDDYLYKPQAFVAMADLLGRGDADFVTPLDHPDRYNHALSTPSPSAVRVTPFGHWRTVGTTCLTFMTSRQVLHERADMIASYGTGAMDGTMWLGLTKEDVRSLRKVIPPVFSFLLRRKRPFGFYMPLCAWKHHGLRLLTTRAYTLWQPLPTLAVHLSSTSLPLGAEGFLPESLRESISALSHGYLEIG